MHDKLLLAIKLAAQGLTIKQIKRQLR